ncbi:hypothetical protein SEA_JACKO_86 [Microbacterium phage Jacko]|nr:hypothetical protein SEA_JACKO_86 [Microbacterium phage Jacko]
MSRKAWVLFVMDPVTAEPVPVKVAPFTRLDRSAVEAAARHLDQFGVPWRIDPIREEVVYQWTRNSRTMQ